MSIVIVGDPTKCYVCGSETMLEYHHIVPRSLGGLTEDGNETLVPLCVSCHKLVHLISRKIISGKTDEADSLLHKAMLENNLLSKENLAFLVKKIVEEFLRKKPKGKEIVVPPLIQFRIKDKKLLLALKQTARSEGSIVKVIEKALRFYLRKKGWEV